MTSPMQVTEDDNEQPGPENQPSSLGGTEDEIKPGLWKLLVAAGGILVVVFLAMELVDDTYLLPSESNLSRPVEQAHG